MKGKVLPLRRVDGRVEELSDEALVAACAVGDANALGALFDRHHRAAYRLLARLSGARGTDVDDLVQITFEQAFRSARRFRGDSRATTWLLGIAANVARRHVRTEVRKRAALEAVRVLPVGSPPIDETVDHRRRVEALAVALAGLSQDLREAFVLCELEGLPGIEAARALGVREGTLWRRLHDARRALLAAIDGGGR